MTVEKTLELIYQLEYVGQKRSNALLRQKCWTSVILSEIVLIQRKIKQ